MIADGALALSQGATATIERRLGEVTDTRVKGREDEDGYDRVFVDAMKKIDYVAPRSASGKSR